MLWCKFRLRVVSNEFRSPRVALSLKPELTRVFRYLVFLSQKLWTTPSPTELLFVWWLRVGGPAISFPGVPFIMRWKNRDEVPIPVADKKDCGLWERDWWSQWGSFALCNLVPRLSDLALLPQPATAPRPRERSWELGCAFQAQMKAEKSAPFSQTSFGVSVSPFIWRSRSPFFTADRSLSPW